MNSYRLLGFFMLLVCSSVFAAEYDATVQWHRKVSLGTAVSGVIKDIPVAAGEKADKDSVLLSLDLTAYQANMESAKAALEAAQTLATEANMEMKRAEDYFEQDLSSRHELELVRIAQVKANAELKKAQADLQHAQYQLRYAKILAPFNGWVLEQNAEIGQVVVADTTAPRLLEFAAADNMRAVAYVPWSSARRMKVGQEVTVVYAEKRLPGKVFSVGMEANKLGYPLQVVFATKGRRIPLQVKVKIIVP